MARLQDATSASDARTSSARNWTTVLTSARRSPILFHTSERCGKFPPKKGHKRPEPNHGDRKVPALDAPSPLGDVREERLARRLKNRVVCLHSSCMHRYQATLCTEAALSEARALTEQCNGSADEALALASSDGRTDVVVALVTAME